MTDACIKLYGYSKKMSKGNVILYDNWDNNSNLKNLKILRQKLFAAWYKDKTSQDNTPISNLNKIFGG